MRLEDRVAIVTGGGQGIGKAISLAFTAEGAAVVLAGRNRKRLEAATDEIESRGGVATAIPTDISDENQIQKLVAQTIDRYSRIDVLVNNAAITGATANVVDIKLQDWNEELAVGLTGTMLCTREVLNHMIPRNSGNIITISSNAGRFGYPMRSPYCVIKWGVNGFTQTLATEVGPHNIRVNAIAPGWVEGERVERAVRTRAEALGRPYAEIYEEVITVAMDRTAMGRIVTPAEVAATAVFLASDTSSGITGQIIDVSAGSRI